ncbi:MAG TPA: AsmA-like C-terminal region-containing protein [Bacteroidales bacterium]|nr:AsmA-like C-terminal region-containing protein [Bacteroidales bacterium]
MKSKKITKIIFKVLGIFIALIIVLAVILPFVFKKQIVEAVKTEINKSVNATVDFKDYHLTLFRNFPDFTLGLDKLTVAGVGDFKGDTLADVEKLRVSIGLFSVISGDQYKINKITLDEPKVHLKVLKGGKANWDIAKPSADTTAKKPAEPSKFKLTIDKLSINDAFITYDDEDGNMHVKAINLNHTLKGNLTADFTSISTKTSIDTISVSSGGITYLKKASLELKADIDADLKNSKYTFKDNEFRLNNLFLAFDGWVAMPKEDIDMDIKFKTLKTDFSNILSLVPAVYAKDFDKIETKGSLALDGFAKGTYNEKSIPSFAVNLLVENAMFKYPSLPKSVTNINLKVNVSNSNGKPDNTVIDVKKLHFEMGANKADIVMHVTTPVSDPNINGTVKANVNLGEVKDFYPLEKGDELSGKLLADVSLKGKLSSIEKEKYEDFQAKGQISVAGMKYKSKSIKQPVMINDLKLLFSPQFVDMPSCDLEIGRSDLRAKGRLDNLLSYIFKDELLKGRFESTSRLLDINEFMSDETQAVAPTSEESSPMLVIEIPANIDFYLNSSFGRVLYDKMDMTNVSGIVTMANRKLTLQNLKMNVLDGTLAVSGSYSTQKPEPEIDLDLDASQFNIPKTFKTFVTVQKLAPIAEKCNGKVSAKVKLTSALDKTMTPIYSTLNGNGSLKLNNVEVKGFEPINKIAEALKIDKFRQLKIDNTSIDITISGGKLYFKPHSFTFEKIKMTLSGWNSLDQTIGYDAVLEIPRELFGGAANGVLNNLVSKANSKGLDIKPGNTIVVAAKIGGTYQKPTITTDIKKSVGDAVDDLKDQVIETVKDKVNETVDKAKEEVSAQAQKLLDEAQKQAQLLREEAKRAGDKLIAEAEKQGQALVDKASNPIAKAAAKETSKQLVKTAREKAAKLNQEAEAKANKILADAQKQADKLKGQ